MARKNVEIEDEQSEKKVTPYEAWSTYFSYASGCDWLPSPEAYQAWDGAVDTILSAVTNELCSRVDLKTLDEVVAKLKTKFKNHP